jgi:hypothetical protein
MQVKDAFLHEFEHVLAFVVLVEGFDDQVDAYGVIEDVLLADDLPGFVVDELQHFLNLLRSDHLYILRSTNQTTAEP